MYHTVDQIEEMKAINYSLGCLKVGNLYLISNCSLVNTVYTIHPMYCRNVYAAALGNQQVTFPIATVN